MRNILLILLVLGLSACSAPLEHGISDPFEASNRKVHQINKSLDKKVVRPIAILYGDSTPLKVQSAVNNISMNFALPGHTVNYILQGKLKSASKSSLKFVVNSTLGVGGVYDASSGLALKTQKTDFGETMARWGVGEGPYLDVIVLGPSNQRDSVGRIVDIIFDPIGLVSAGPKGLAALTSIGLGLSARSQFRESIDSILYESTDSYAQSRLFFLQNRRYVLGTAQTEPYIDPYN